jgi:hypothetical protein
MNITKRTKILVIGAAAAVAAGVTSSAFTGGGLTDSSTDDFIGGSERVTISGAVIVNVSYDLAPTTDDIDSVTVWFTGNVLTRQVQLVFNPASGPALPTYTCTNIADNGGHLESVCTPTVVGQKADANQVDTVDFTVEN